MHYIKYTQGALDLDLSRPKYGELISSIDLYGEIQSLAVYVRDINVNDVVFTPCRCVRTLSNK